MTPRTKAGKALAKSQPDWVRVTGEWMDPGEAVAAIEAEVLAEVRAAVQSPLMAVLTISDYGSTADGEWLSRAAVLAALDRIGGAE